MKKKASLQQSGQSILEVLIATMVVGMVMVAIAAGLTASVKNTSESRYRALATSQAQEVMEAFRRERTRLGWYNFSQNINSGVYCFNQIPAAADDFVSFLNSNKAACSDTVLIGNQNFKRQAIVSNVDNGSEIEAVSVEVTMSWNDGKRDRSVVVNQTFKQI